MDLTDIRFYVKLISFFTQAEKYVLAVFHKSIPVSFAF